MSGDSVAWTGTNDSEVIDFLDRWHLGDAWMGGGWLFLGRPVHLGHGDSIVRNGPQDWAVVLKVSQSGTTVGPKGSG